MLLCGAEEPVGPNPQLYALDEDADRIELSTFGIPSASRYSFLWLGPPTDASAAFTAVLRDILLRLDMPATWCVVWEHHGQGDLAGQSRTKAWRRRKEGWEVRIDADLGIATQAIAPADVTWPLKHDGPGAVLLLGAGVSSEVLLQAPARSALAFLARGRMAPGRKLILWLVQHGWSIAYREQDDVGRPGCILVGKHRIQVDDLKRAGLVGEVRWNERAAGVWRCPP